MFAEHGYRGGSVRLITQAAGANQAAITYHFNGKDGLYRAVLREAIAAFEEQSLLERHDVEGLDRGQALGLVIRQFLLPLSQPGRLGRYVQILGWEAVHPSPVYIAFFAEETPRLFRTVERLVRRFLPDPVPEATVERLVRRFLPADATDGRIKFTAFWLVQQPIAFVRNAERLRSPPYSQTFDEAGITRIARLLTTLSLHGLQEGPALLRS